MTDKTTAAFPPDAIPRRYRDQLVPAFAAGVPEPVAEASERLRVAGLEAQRASADRRAADTAAKAAPRADSQAAIAAVEAGQDPPSPTAPEREREALVAAQRDKAAKQIAHSASISLERAIRDHRNVWLEAQRTDTQQREQDALDAVDGLSDALDLLSRSAGTVAALQTTPEGRVIEHGRRFKPRPLGHNKGTNVPSTVRLVAELRDAIAATMPDPLPADGPLTPEQEALRDTQRAYRQMGQGGVVVAGGGWS